MICSERGSAAESMSPYFWLFIQDQTLHKKLYDFFKVAYTCFWMLCRSSSSGHLEWKAPTFFATFRWFDNLKNGTAVSAPKKLHSWFESHLEKNPTFLLLKMDVFRAHREFWLWNAIGKTCLWKKYILLYE